MSFKVTLTNEDHQNVFCRTITQISSINKELSICVTPSRMIVSARNSMFTGICEVAFVRAFFQEYEFDLSRADLGTEGIKEQTYSFKISSLSLLFKNINFRANVNPIGGGNNSGGSANGGKDGQQDAGGSGGTATGLEELVLQVDNSVECEDEYVNKLMVTMKTRNNITKEYLPNIIPCSFEYVTLERDYKLNFWKTYGENDSVDIRLRKLFKDIELNYTRRDPEFFDEYEEEQKQDTGSETGLLEVNYIKSLLVIWKKFIDNLNSNNIEEFKIDIDGSELKCEAFTKSIVSQKTNEILKNGMFTMNTIPTKDLENTCLYHGKESVTVRLKDFKMFINLSNFWNNARRQYGNEDDSDGLETHCLNMWFANNGFPMFLEMNYLKLVKFQLFLITDYKQQQLQQQQQQSGNGEAIIKQEMVKQENVPLVISKPTNKLFVDEDGPDDGDSAWYEDVPQQDDPIEQVKPEVVPPHRHFSGRKRFRKSSNEEPSSNNDDSFQPQWKNAISLGVTTETTKKRTLVNKGVDSMSLLENAREDGEDDEDEDDDGNVDNTDVYLHTRNNIQANPAIPTQKTNGGDDQQVVRKETRVEYGYPQDVEMADTSDNDNDDDFALGPTQEQPHINGLFD